MRSVMRIFENGEKTHGNIPFRKQKEFCNNWTTRIVIELWTFNAKYGRTVHIFYCSYPQTAYAKWLL